MSTKRNYIFYKLCCDDYDDIYIGSSCNFANRKYEHKSSVNNPNAKNYNCYKAQFIRENGGWDNWRMIQIDSKDDITKREAEMYEEQLRQEYKPTLNTIKAYTTREEQLEQYKEYNKTRDPEANKIRSKAYREANKDKIAESKNNWYLKNKTEFNKKRREKYEKNNEQIKEMAREYYKNNKEAVKERKKNYVEANKEAIAEYKKNWYLENKQKK